MKEKHVEIKCGCECDMQSIDCKCTPMNCVHFGKRLQQYKHKDDMEESVSCERCGGECSPRMVGDETYNYCSECRSITT